MTYGRWCFWINACPEGSNISRYQTYKQVEKSTGRTPKEMLSCPKLRAEHYDAWEAYTELKEYTWTELKAYIEMTGHLLAPWETRAIMTLSRFREATPKWPLK